MPSVNMMQCFQFGWRTDECLTGCFHRRVHRRASAGGGDKRQRLVVIDQHPPIGRMAVLLATDGAKLRWLPQAASRECFQLDPQHAVPLAESAEDQPLAILNACYRRRRANVPPTHSAPAKNPLPGSGTLITRLSKSWVVAAKSPAESNPLTVTKLSVKPPVRV